MPFNFQWEESRKSEGVNLIPTLQLARVAFVLSSDIEAKRLEYYYEALTVTLIMGHQINRFGA